MKQDVEIEARRRSTSCLGKFLMTFVILVLLLLVGAKVFEWLVMLG